MYNISQFQNKQLGNKIVNKIVNNIVNKRIYKVNKQKLIK